MTLRIALSIALVTTSALAQNSTSAPSPTSAASSTPSAEPGPLPSFIIADIHPSPRVPYPGSNGGQLFGDRYIFHQATMLDLISAAYSLTDVNVQGGPSWLERDRFDITAKTPPKTPPAQLKLMLRQLLIDRFQLVAHNGMKPMPAWILTVKDKDKIRESGGSGDGCKNDGPPAEPDSGPPHVIALSCANFTMEEFAGMVRNFIGGDNAVIDQTGMSGKYDFAFKATPSQLIPQAGSDAIPMATALEKQLGLHIELLTAPREVLLVDTVLRKPTPNSPEVAKLLPPLPPPEFDVATIKPSNPETKGARGNIQGGQVNVQNFTLKMLIPIAWNLNEGDDNVIANAPKWFDTDKIDILAKVSPEAMASNAASGNSIDFDQLRVMLQKLLIERFQIKSHMEERPIDSYRLIAVNPKLHPADSNGRTVCKEGPGADGKDPRPTNPALDRLLTCTNISMDEVADELQRQANGYIHNTIENATGLTGRYDFTLSFSMSQTLNAALAAAAANNDPNKASSASGPIGAISLLEALPKQLGLKLEKVKRTLPVLVIDSANEKPLDN
jgi:uncharacterized protein (TIGR03435 family)